MRTPPLLLFLLGLVVLFVLFTVITQGLILLGVLDGRVLWSQVCLAVYLTFGLFELSSDRQRALRTLMTASSAAGLVFVGMWLLQDDFKPGPIFLTTLVGSTLAMIGFAICYRKTFAPGSYGDWLTNPDFREAAAMEFAAVDAALESDRENPPDPHDVVEDLLDPEISRFVTRRRLMEIDDSKTPALQAAMEDPRFAPQPEDDDESPYGILLRLLPDPPPVELAPALERIATAPGFELAEKCSGLWIKTGDPAALQHTLDQLNPDAESFWRVCSALEDLARSDRVPPSFRDPVGARLQALLEAEPDSTPMEALVAIDRDRATKFLVEQWDSESGEDSDSGESHGAAQMVAAFLGGEGKLPPQMLQDLAQRSLDQRRFNMFSVLLPDAEWSSDRLVTTLEALKEHAACYHARAAAKFALEELLRREAPRSRELIEQVAEWEDDEIRSFALATLNLVDGLPRSPDVHGHYERVGWEKLDEPQRLYYVMGFTASLTSNGGFVQAADCLDEDLISTLLSGLAQLPKSVRDPIEEGFALLFPQGTPIERDQRIALIAENYARVEAKLGTVDTAIWESEWVIEAFRVGLIRKNPESFRSLEDELSL